jgi:hypothetical protein
LRGVGRTVPIIHRQNPFVALGDPAGGLSFCLHAVCRMLQDVPAWVRQCVKTLPLPGLIARASVLQPMFVLPLPIPLPEPVHSEIVPIPG